MYFGFTLDFTKKKIVLIFLVSKLLEQKGLQ